MWSKEHDRDGLIPLALLPFLCAKLTIPPDELAAELLAVGLWERLDGGVGIPYEKWRAYQITVARRVVATTKNRERQRAKRERDRAARNGDSAYVDPFPSEPTIASTARP
jgi:hypothetical protein